jgi:RNA polymerase sigma-70 factor (ECF subfamily)
MTAAAECEAPMAEAMDDEALAQAYQRFSWRVFVLCRHLLGSADAARDATNEVFLRAQQAKKQFDPSRPMEGWLMGIARNYSVDQLRRRGTEQRLFLSAEEEVLEPAAAGPSPLGDLLQKERTAAFRKALNGLGEQGRKALMLRYESEMSYEQIGEALGISRNEVGVLLFRAKEQLRRILQAGPRESLE